MRISDWSSDVCSSDLVHRLIDAAPHIIVSDELRSPSPQPGVRAFPDAAVTLHGYKVRTEARGLKDWPAIMAVASAFPGAISSPSLTGGITLKLGGQDRKSTRLNSSH